MAKKTAKAPAKKQAPAKKAAVAKKPNVSKAKPAAKVAAKSAPKSAKPAAKSVAKAAAQPVTKPAKAAAVAPPKEGVAAKLLSAAKSLLGGKKSEETSKPAPPVKALRLVKNEEPDVVDDAAPAVAQVRPAPAAREDRVLSAAKPGKVKPAKRVSKAEKISAGDDEAKWNEYHDRYKSDRAPVYDMKATFEAGTPLQHKLLGWGWILASENDRLEVLFKDGRRMLISNYNPGR